MMPAAPETDDARVRAEARDWLLRMMSAEGDPDADEEREACRRWRAIDPRHDRAYRLAERAWQGLGATDMARTGAWRPAAQAAAQSPAPARRAPWRRAAVPVALAASLAAILALPTLFLRPDVAVETGVGQIRHLALQDGSRIDVGAKSAVEVRYEPKRRTVLLDRGQAFFDVAHDAVRPFIVLSGDAEIHVTGTKFDVKRIGDDVRVSVLEGRVELRRRPLLPLPIARRETPPERVVTGGKATELSEQGGFEPLKPAVENPGSWREGRLYYIDRPLSEAIADANRYSATPIRLADEKVGTLRITTSFRTGAIDDFLAGVTQTLPVRVERQGDGTIMIAPGQAG